MSYGADLRELFARDGLVIAPGAYDGLTARLVELAGFSVVYATGAGISNSQLALADVGLITMALIALVLREPEAATAQRRRRIRTDLREGELPEAALLHRNALRVRRTVQHPLRFDTPLRQLDRLRVVDDQRVGQPQRRIAERAQQVTLVREQLSKPSPLAHDATPRPLWRTRRSGGPAAFRRSPGTARNSGSPRSAGAGARPNRCGRTAPMMPT